MKLLRGRWYSVVYYEGDEAGGFSSGELIRDDLSGEGELMFNVPGEPYSRSVYVSEIISILSARRQPIPLGFRRSRTQPRRRRDASRIAPITTAAGEQG